MPAYIDSSLLFLAAFFIFVVVSVGVILVLWMAMPFSVFGVKRLLKKTIEEQEKTNRLLKAMLEKMHEEPALKEEHETPEKREDLH